jgi:hypothetical protein
VDCQPYVRHTSVVQSARTVIVVIYLRDGLIGVNAWKANPTQASRYWGGSAVTEQEGEDEA